MSFRTLPLLRLTFVLLLSASARGATIGKADNPDDLNLGSSWIDGVPPGAGDLAVWTNAVATNSLWNLGADLAWLGLAVIDPAATVTLQGANTLTLLGGGIGLSNSAPAVTLNHTVLAGADQTWRNEAANPLTFGGAVLRGTDTTFTITLSGSGDFLFNGQLGNAPGTHPILVKAGTGTNTLAGAADNDGLVLTNAGGETVLAKASSASVHALGGGLTVAGGTVRWAGSGGDQIRDDNLVTVNGGRLDLGTQGETIGALVQNGGRIEAAAGTLTVGSYTMTAGTNLAAMSSTGLLVKAGATNSLLGGASSFAGVSVQAANLVLGPLASLATTSLTITGTTSRAKLYLGADNQFPSNVVLNIGIVSNQFADLVLMGHNLTVAALNGGEPFGSGFTLIENSFQESNIGTNGILTIDNAVDCTYQGVIRNNGGGSATNTTGTFGLIKQGTGTLTIANSSSQGNSYSGGTWLKAGVLRIGTNSPLGANAGTNTFQGGTLSSDSTNARTANNQVVFDGSITLGDTVNNGTLTLGGAARLASGSQLTVLVPVNLSGALSGTNVLTKAGDSRLTLSSISGTFSGAMVVASGMLVGNGNSLQGAISNDATVIFDHSGIYTNLASFSGPGTIIKTNSGTVIFVLSNACNGAVTISQGGLQLRNAFGLGQPTNVVVASGARLELDGGLAMTGFPLTINGNGGNNYGGLQSKTGSNVWYGPVLLGNTGNTRIGAETGTLEIAGTIDDGPNTVDLNLRGNNDSNAISYGTIILSGVSTYNGNTAIIAGTLQLEGGDDRLPPGALMTIGNSSAFGPAIFDLHGYSQQVGGLVSISNMRNHITNAAPATSTLTISNAADRLFSGDIMGNIALVKRGNGTQTLGGRNIHTGNTTIVAGTLAFTNLATLTNSPLISVAAGATISMLPRTGQTLRLDPGQTLAGAGTVLGNIQNRGTLAPGEPLGLLTVGSYTQEAAGILSVELAGTNAYDTLATTGAVVLAGTLLVATNGYTAPQTGDTFTIVSAASITGTFATLSAPPGIGFAVLYDATNVQLVVTNLSAAPPTPYETWAQSFGLPGSGSETNDTDGDGYANLLEYATGGNPTNADTVARLSATMAAGLLHLKFNRDSNAVDAVYQVEAAFAATNNAVWLGVATNVNGSWGGAANVSETGTNPVQTTVSDVLPGATNRFMRLRVTKP